MSGQHRQGQSTNASPWHLTSESHEHHGPVTEMREWNTCNPITLSFIVWNLNKLSHGTLTLMNQSTEAQQWRRPGPDLAATTIMQRPAEEVHDEHMHLHQVNLQKYTGMLVLQG